METLHNTVTRFNKLFYHKQTYASLQVHYNHHCQLLNVHCSNKNSNRKLPVFSVLFYRNPRTFPNCPSRRQASRAVSYRRVYFGTFTAQRSLLLLTCTAHGHFSFSQNFCDLRPAWLI